MLRIDGTEVFIKPDRVVVDKDGVSIYVGTNKFHFEIIPDARFDGCMYHPELTLELDKSRRVC